MNKPNVDQEKACARLLLHKSLQDKYKFIRNRFSSVPIEDLLMSRDERKRLKKEAREKQKNKKKGKGDDNKVVNAEGDWNVEDVDMTAVKGRVSDDELSNDGDGAIEDEQSSDDDNQDNVSGNESDGHESGNDEVYKSDSESNNDDNNDIEDILQDEKSSESDDSKSDNVGQFVKLSPEKPLDEPFVLNSKATEIKTKVKEVPKTNKQDKKKDKNKQDKNKNLNEKLLSRKFKKEISESPMHETKVVDPFFITSTGENYMSMVEPRQPDEVKEEHKRGNRKLRRAAMFGHVPKIKPKRDDFRHDNDFSRNNGFNKSNSFKTFDNSDVRNSKRSFTDRRSNFDRNGQDVLKPEKQEKLHPSWEAKKKQSGILPFQGKKIVFDES